MNLLIGHKFEIYRLGIVSGLKRSNIEITSYEEASSGWEVIDKCLDTDYDLVILENELFELEGLVAARMVLSKRPKLKILFYCFETKEHLIKQAQKIGAVGYLSAKTETEVLVKTVNSIMNRSD